MKKNKKNAKKNNRYNGRNIFGQRCVAKTLKLNKENALDQCIQMLNEVMTSDVVIEYTLDWSAFTPEEAHEVQEKLNRYCALRRLYC